MRFPAAVAWVALGGAIGTYARVAVTEAFAPALAVTLAVNVLGAFLLGALVTGFEGGGNRDGGRRRQRARLLLGTGFCGGFTTYSLIALQAATLARSGDGSAALAYCVVTLVLGAVATALGVVLAAWARNRARDRAPGAA
ncbi:fluoride efflux transporter FluC [Dietzia lutea]|uniref:Fluoride-specific ion channel FluC n=1 Tax=Dietzia lutea TaxID=546160 RepID=A0A2S1R450_9ACTN|nr:CrcB family protein [Dietzia lutea]AWH91035.1 camphor resistance protein CrcB [Dietzia lutea]